ncbi:MAG: hypothetical protein MUC63_08325 [Planctomycetes bacterium]|jgi:hypothetical protein|nr:hypothetical protein [Planctomycetota bacterium]
MRRLAIGFLAALLVSAALPAFGQEVVRESRVYDIEFLTRSVEDFPGAPLHLPRGDEAMPPAMDAETEALLGAQTLVGMIRANVDPDSWNNVKNSIRAEEGKLRVVQEPENLKRIDALLRELRTRFGDFVEIEGYVLRLKAKALAEALAELEAGKGGVLTEEGARRLLAGAASGAVRVEEAATVLAFSGQRVHASPLRQRSIVRDLDVEVAKSVAVVDPVVSTLSEGFVLDARATVVGRAGILLDLWLSSLTLEDPLPSLETPGGRIDLPAARAFQANATLVVPDGGAALLCGRHPADGDEGTAFLVRVRRKGLAALPGEERKGDKDKAKRTLRVYNVRLLTRRIEDFRPGSARLGRRTGPSYGAGPGFMEEAAPEGVGLTAEEIENLVTANIAEDSWANERNTIECSGGCLAVLQEEAVHAQIEEFLRSLEARRVVLAHLAFRWLSADDALLAALFPDGLKAPFTAVDPKARAALLDAAAEGTRASWVGAASLVAFNRQRAFVARRNVAAFVADNDVEVAESAAIADPIVDACADGVVLDARATVAGDGKNVTLDLRPALALMERPFPAVKYRTEQGEWPIQVPSVRTEEVQTSVTLPDGGTAVFLGGRNLAGKDRRLVLLVTVKLARPGE